MCIFLLEIILKFVAYGLQAPSLGGVKLSHAVSSIYLPISILTIDIYGVILALFGPVTLRVRKAWQPRHLLVLQGFLCGRDSFWNNLAAWLGCDLSVAPCHT